MISLYPTESKIPHSGRCVNAGIFFIKTKKARFCRVFLMVVGQGFEPWKAMPTDLQSVLFDRSRIPPEIIASLRPFLSED